MDFKFHGLNIPISREVMPAFLALCRIVCMYMAARNLSSFFPTCYAVTSATLLCVFIMVSPPLLTSVGNKILVPGVVERL